MIKVFLILYYKVKIGGVELGKIISIANQKGGVGKTTTSVNLSAILAKKGKKTLMLDMDPQGNGTSGLGIDKNVKLEKVLPDLVQKHEKYKDYRIRQLCQEIHDFYK